MPRLSPLRQYETALAHFAGHHSPAYLVWARRNLARARRRLVLAALAYLVVASVGAVIIWLLAILAVALVK